jgi:hypothetical protein
MTVIMKATADLQGAFGATFTTKEEYETKEEALEALKEWVSSDYKPIKAGAITSLKIEFIES